MLLVCRLLKQLSVPPTTLSTFLRHFGSVMTNLLVVVVILIRVWVVDAWILDLALQTGSTRLWLIMQAIRVFLVRVVVLVTCSVCLARELGWASLLRVRIWTGGSLVLFCVTVRVLRDAESLCHCCRLLFI